MPTPVGHVIGGVSVYLAARGRPSQDDLRFVAACVGVSLLPDLDFAIGPLTGRNYHHFTHSLGSRLSLPWRPISLPGSSEEQNRFKTRLCSRQFTCRTSSWTCWARIRHHPSAFSSFGPFRKRSTSLPMRSSMKYGEGRSVSSSARITGGLWPERY